MSNLKKTDWAINVIGPQGVEAITDIAFGVDDEGKAAFRLGEKIVNEDTLGSGGGGGGPIMVNGEIAPVIGGITYLPDYPTEETLGLDQVKEDVDTLKEDVAGLEQNITVLDQKVDNIGDGLENVSFALQDEIDRAIDAENELSEQVEEILELIPNQASSSNQLADKDFVNSSIATNTAYYISKNGQPFESLEELQAYSGTLTNNDYAFVVTRNDDGEITAYNRYKYNATTAQWAYEYTLNNSSFTAVQWAAINSGITALLVSQISINAQDIENIKTNKLSADDLKTVDGQSIVGSGNIPIPVKGALLGGASGVQATQATIDANGNIVVPVAGTVVPGVVYTSPARGIEMLSNGVIAPITLTQAHLNARGDGSVPMRYYCVTINMLNNSVIAALTDANHITLNATQQATARSVFGAIDGIEVTRIG